MKALAAENVGLAFDGVVAVDDVSFSVESGKIFSIIGPNGAGKTTLFNIMSGIYRPSSGRVLLAGEDVTGLQPNIIAAKGLARTFQNLQIFMHMSAVENVMVGRHIREARNLTKSLLRFPSVGRQNRATRAKALELLQFVGLADRADRPAGSLPYGGLRRLEIARALALEPRILLLDEPAAGCNPVETEAVEALVREIARWGITVVLVEHNMRFVMRISDRILVLDSGRKLAEGVADEVRRNPEVIEAYLGRHGSKEAAHARN